jgi:hypothetical protein
VYQRLLRAADRSDHPYLHYHPPSDGQLLQVPQLDPLRQSHSGAVPIDLGSHPEVPLLNDSVLRSKRNFLRKNVPYFFLFQLFQQKRD